MHGFVLQSLPSMKPDMLTKKHDGSRVEKDWQVFGHSTLPLQSGDEKESHEN